MKTSKRKLRGGVTSTFAFLAFINIAAWIWAFVVFRESPVLLGTTFIAYSFGLRHAVDADHIAAIDNVTRKLMQEGKQPLLVGLFFSLGHSTVVVIAAFFVFLTATALENQFAPWKQIGAIIGTSVSAIFLFVIAAMNILIKLYYNMTITLVSVGIALFVGGIEAIGLLKDQLNLQGGVWDLVGNLNDNFGSLGFLIIAVFLVAWAASVLFFRLKGFDNLE